MVEWASNFVTCSLLFSLCNTIKASERISLLKMISLTSNFRKYEVWGCYICCSIRQTFSYKMKANNEILWFPKGFDIPKGTVTNQSQQSLNKISWNIGDCPFPELFLFQKWAHVYTVHVGLCAHVSASIIVYVPNTMPPPGRLDFMRGLNT